MDNLVEKDKFLERYNLPRLNQEEIENMNRPITNNEIETRIKNLPTGGFPGGTVVESLPANAGDTGSSPGLGRSHMPWSNCAREPRLLSLCIWMDLETVIQSEVSQNGKNKYRINAYMWNLEKWCR